MFDALLVLLARADIAFVVVGGVAVAEAGFARFTEDLDLLVDASETNVERFIAALSAYGDGAAADLTLADFPDEEGAVRILDEIALDVFTRMSGRTYADLLPLTTTREIGGTTIHFLNAEGLIALKAPSLRPKDRLDAEALRAILRGERL